MGETCTNICAARNPRRKLYASGTIKNRVSIDERPEIVAEKTRMGDWEGDTVIDKNHKGGLVTLAERKSRYVLAGHESIAAELQASIHSAHPYHSWERGVNENSNGLF
jgi:IS30 family transposase